MSSDHKSDAMKIRRRIVDLAHKAGKNGAHLGGSLSCVEILMALYGSCHIDQTPERDRIILSKGHGALALYATLEHLGRLSAEDVDTFETNGTHFYAHAPRDLSRYIEFSGGSLSLGMSWAVGVALSCKKRQIDNHIYTVIGDGECDEGLVWEAAMSAAHYKLDRFTVIVDCNGVQLDGPTDTVMDTHDLADKFRAFGFYAIEADGHDIDSLLKALAITPDRPKAIIARTVKGKGLSFCEGQSAWHHGVLTDALYQQACNELI